WWNEALHGVAQHRATVFPEPIGLGASFDPALVHRMADTISTEARAKFQEAQRRPPITDVAPGAVPHRLSGLLVAQHQHFSRPTLGTRPGNLWRGSLPHRPDGCRFRHRDAGRRPPLSENDRYSQALRGA